MRDCSSRLQQFAQEGRRHLTGPEALLWSRLKGRQLAGLHMRRQHPVAPYIADFACVRARLLIEVDGSDHGYAHRLAEDARRTTFMESQGWTVLRFTNAEVLKALPAVLRRIEQAALSSPAEAGA